MRYSPKQYALALLAALDGKTGKKRHEVLQKFWQILTRNNEQKLWGFIVETLEKEYLKEKGVRKIELESASPPTAGLKKEIEGLLGSKLIFHEKLKPELLAGIRVLIDGEHLIDASGKTQLAKLFS